MHRKAFLLIRDLFPTLGLPIILVVGIGWIRALLGNYGPVLFQQLLDRLSPSTSFDSLVPVLVAYAAVTLLNHLLIYGEGYPGTLVHRGVAQGVKLRALAKMGHIDFQAYQNLGTGNLVQIIENGAEAIRKILTGFYMGTLHSIAQILISLYFIQRYDSGLFWVIVLLFGVFYVTADRLMTRLHRTLDALLADQEDFSKFSVRALMELVVFRVNNRVEAEYRRLKGLSDTVVRAQARVYLFQELSYTGLAILVFLVEAGVVVDQVLKILAGQSTLGTLVALVWFVRQIFWPVIGFGQTWVAYTLDLQTFERLDRVWSLPDDPGQLQGQSIRLTSGRIQLAHVSFRYLEQGIVQDLNLMIEPGETTAIVGPSGSGKSTLLRLLLHLIRPQTGQVLVDGQDLGLAHLPSYYAQVAYVAQDPPIFDGTLRENLTFDREIPDDRIRAVVGQVGLDVLLSRLPDQLETLVGERGTKLSGGERHRLALGRILLQDPKLVILDEPTAALDSLTEAEVTEQLMLHLKGRTLVVVAHRLQTVRAAEHIVVLDQGRIVQRGSFGDLVKHDGLFQRMWNEQARTGQAM